MILIHGFFFFNGPQLGITYDQSGAIGVIREVVQRSMFAGVIGPERKGSKVLTGRMTDHYGGSELIDIEIEDGRILFTKVYDRRSDGISYLFKKDADGTWDGTFVGRAVGSGQARCILTIVPEDFLLPSKVAKSVKKIKGRR